MCWTLEWVWINRLSWHKLSSVQLCRLLMSSCLWLMCSHYFINIQPYSPLNWILLIQWTEWNVSETLCLIGNKNHYLIWLYWIHSNVFVVEFEWILMNCAFPVFILVCCIKRFVFCDTGVLIMMHCDSQVSQTGRMSSPLLEDDYKPAMEDLTTQTVKVSSQIIVYLVTCFTFSQTLLSCFFLTYM